jgi:hypothetical protein
MLLLAFTIWQLLGIYACASRGATIGNANDPVIQYDGCSQILSESRYAFIADGMRFLLSVVYNQYINQPTGPFVFCFENIPTSENDTVGDMVLSVHPFLPRGTLNELVSDTEDMAGYFDLKKMTLLSNIDKGGELYNFTEPFDQFQLNTSNTISLSKQLNSFAGFIQDAADGWVHCACQYTSVPDVGTEYNHDIKKIASDSRMTFHRHHFRFITVLLAVAYF